MIIRKIVRALSSVIVCFSLSHIATISAAESASPTVESLSIDGEFEIRAYTGFPDVPEFADATIYYPLNTDMPIAGVAVAPGFTERQRHINWWGPRLASHGFAVLVLDTNELRDRPDVRGDALMAAVAILRGENSRSGSPLFGKIKESKMAIMGHSMGGGGTLIAANEHSDKLAAAIPFTPWQPDGDFSNITVPTLVMAGSADRIAPVAAHAVSHFESIPSTTTKVYMEFDGGNHFIANTTRDIGHDIVGRYGIAWLKLYLDDDERYRDFIYGNIQKADREKFSKYITSP